MGCLALLLGACRTPPAARPEPLGQWYVVQQGETLAEIARRSGVPAKSRSVRDQRPWVAVTTDARARENRRGRRSGFGTP